MKTALIPKEANLMRRGKKMDPRGKHAHCPWREGPQRAARLSQPTQSRTLTALRLQEVLKWVSVACEAFEKDKKESQCV